MDTINKYRCEKDPEFRNTAGAAFYKALDSDEGYYHICDHIRKECMPEVFRHDVHSWLYLGQEHIYIKFCPICGKSLD